MAAPRVGIQLIVFGERTGKDLEGVMKDVKAAGYDGIEAGNLFRQRSETEAKALFEKTGLVLAGTHAGYAEFANEEKVKENVAFLNGMGARYLMCSGVAPGDSLDAYRQSAEVFNRAGRYCRDHGVTFCYHNHNWEFKRFTDAGGTEVTAIHELCSLTDPELVKLCIDVYWVAVGGEDPAAFIRRYANRAAYFHFKDGEWEEGHPGKATRFLELGHGRVNLRSALDAALAVNPEWIVTEQDTPNGRDPAVCARESREHLKNALGL
ncbi:MAG TPA: sugar phosphate isomerase/epimerase [Armatimonadota bacterium]|nr:sugar phosphate isomerase/epimerase [Armatimonadota bacterium]